jgi:biopolymer transport protein ExbB
MNTLIAFQATETATTIMEPVIEPSFWETTVRFMQDGGTFMYIILALFLIGLAIAIERFLYLSTVKTQNRMFWKKCQPLLQKGDMPKVEQLTSSSRAGLAQILNYGLMQSKNSKRQNDIEMALEEGLMEVMPKLEKRTPYLATFANIATLLGLLGTIMGLISAFTAVANVDPAEKANLLSASISVAMNTTAFGLMAAIPLLLSFSFLQTKTTEIVDSLEMVSVKFVNLLKSNA